MKTKILAVAMALAAFLAVFAAMTMTEDSDATLTPRGSGANGNGSVTYYLSDDNPSIPLIQVSLNKVQHPYYSIMVKDINDLVTIEDATLVGASTPMSIGLREYLGQDNTESGGHNLASITEYKVYFKANDAANYDENDFIPLMLTTYKITPAVATSGVTDEEITEGGWVATILDGESDVSDITVYAGAVVTMTGSEFQVKDTTGATHTVTATAPTATAKTDKYTYAFGAWNDGTSDQSETMAINGNVTLTATFTATINTHMVVIDSTIESVLNGDNPVTSGSQVAYGTELTINAVKTGYDTTITVNSSEEGSEGTATYSMSTEDLFIAASFEPQIFTVTFTADEDENFEDDEIEETYDSTYSFPENSPVWAGHEFIGWKFTGGSSVLTADSIVKITDDTTAIAQWAIKQFTVTYSSDITGVSLSGSPISNGGLADYGTALTATIVSKTGYTAQLQANGSNAENGVYTVPEANVYLTVVYTPEEYTLGFTGAAVAESQVDTTKISFVNGSQAVITELEYIAHDQEILVNGASLVIGENTVTASYAGTSGVYDFVLDHWAIVIGGAEETELVNGAKVSGNSTIKAYFNSVTKGAFTVTASCATENIDCVVTDKMTADSTGILKIVNTSGNAYTYSISDNVRSTEIAEGVFKIWDVQSDVQIVVTATAAADANLRAFYVTSMSGSNIGVYIETNDDRFPTGAAVTLTGMGYIMVDSVRTYYSFGSSAYDVTNPIADEEESHYAISFALKNLYGKAFTAHSVTATYTGDGKTATTSKVVS